MTTAREIMTPNAKFLETGTTVLEAAKRMASEDLGAMPVCDGGRLQGMLTDRDIVVKVLAEGKDPGSCTVESVADQREVVTIGADDDVDTALRAMKEHDVRRLPVIDGDELVGMVAQADIARSMGDERAGDLVGDISSAPPNN